MRSDSIRKVEHLLARTDKGVTVQYIKAHTALSYSTVKRALEELGAKMVPGTWPVEWTIGSERQVANLPDIRRDGTEQAVLVPLREHIDNLASIWNKSALTITEKLGAVKLEPDTDLSEVIERFRNAAELFASMTHQLEQVQNIPDWFSSLSDQEEAEQFESSVVS